MTGPEAKLLDECRELMRAVRRSNRAAAAEARRGDLVRSAQYGHRVELDLDRIERRLDELANLHRGE